MILLITDGKTNKTFFLYYSYIFIIIILVIFLGEGAMIAFLPQGAGGQGGSASTQLKTLMEQVFTITNLLIDWLI